jgi:4-amino-4-deoxy-L-arabinose transferase-like glycosyltransferase
MSSRIGSRVRPTLPFYRKLIWIFVLAFVVRVAVRCFSGGPDFWVNGYSFFFALAQNIAAGNGYTLDGVHATAFRVPLYPFFIAAVTFGHQLFLPIILSQSLVSVGTVLCAAMLAREIFGNKAAIIAAILTAIYPYYVVHDTALQETSLFTFLTTLAVFLLLRLRRSGSVMTALGAGLALGAAVLTRANLAPFALFAPLWLVFSGDSNAAPWRRRLRSAVLCAGVAALTVSPWLIRSYELTGTATLSTQTGFFLWVGNNPYTFSHYPEESIDRSQATALASLSVQDKTELNASGSNEAEIDRWFQKKGLDYIREHPWQTLGNSVRKVSNAFGWLPSPRRDFWPNLIQSLSYGPIMILGLWGMWAYRSRWREYSIFFAQFVSFAAVTAVFFGHTSYRAYLDVYWIVFAAGVMAAWHVNPFRIRVGPTYATQ